MRWLACILLLCTLSVRAEERVMVCFNYGCLAQAEVVYGDEQLRQLGLILGQAHDAAQERVAIGIAVGRLLDWAGKQSPIFADRGGNYADDGVYGKMDCIDHSTTTTRLLHLMDRRGLLRYHRVLEPVVRRSFLIFEHYTALIEEVEQAGGRRYVVDSWFFDNGQPAVVMPLAQWRAGESPNVGE
ncbi:hypothetical protein [Propionivibrio sp.]|uniref:hypothetical protein n=1 Tax=Propionivibrio sp. TaxID=2212460 RepID=UPI002635B5F5|nr:hypothetical protein [Propionivibrio sp.]